jgi:hypothetical protein
VPFSSSVTCSVNFPRFKGGLPKSINGKYSPFIKYRPKDTKSDRYEQGTFVQKEQKMIGYFVYFCLGERENLKNRWQRFSRFIYVGMP